MNSVVCFKIRKLNQGKHLMWLLSRTFQPLLIATQRLVMRILSQQDREREKHGLLRERKSRFPIRSEQENVQLNILNRQFSISTKTTYRIQALTYLLLLLVVILYSI